MIKAMQMICGFVMVLDLIGFFLQGDIHCLLLAGVMFICLDYWMRWE